MTVSKVSTYISFVVLVMASFILAPGSAGHAGDRARTIHDARFIKSDEPASGVESR